MGPSIILDKSVMQGLSQAAIFELGRYFLITVPDVLLLETLADLSLVPDDPDKSMKTVIRVANKALPFNAFPNVDYRQLCAQNLLGYPIEMSGRPIVAAQMVTQPSHF